MNTTGRSSKVNSCAQLWCQASVGGTTRVQTVTERAGESERASERERERERDARTHALARKAKHNNARLHLLFNLGRSIGIHCILGVLYHSTVLLCSSSRINELGSHPGFESCHPLHGPGFQLCHLEREGWGRGGYVNLHATIV